jgi:hypothetical protein
MRRDRASEAASWLTADRAPACRSGSQIRSTSRRRRFTRAKQTFTRWGLKLSESELANACLVEAEVMTNLVTHRLGDVQPEPLGIVPKVAY